MISADTIIAMDLSPQKGANHVKYAEGDASAMCFANDTFDLICSRSVLEHVIYMEDFLRESLRVLRPGGIFYAEFGPLWESYGGTHVGALGYDHLRLGDDQLLAAARDIGNGWEWWLEKGLFNRLRLDEYLSLFYRYFDVRRIIVAGSPEARRYRQLHPAAWSQLLDTHSEVDLMTRLVSITALKPRSG